MKKIYVTMLVLMLVSIACITSTPTPVPIPTRDFSSQCQEFAEQAKPYLDNESDVSVVKTTCESEMPEAIGSNWFQIGQHIVQEVDKKGVNINDWRGHTLAEIFAKIFGK